jgi:hypothetical protein
LPAEIKRDPIMPTIVKTEPVSDTPPWSLEARQP